MTGNGIRELLDRISGTYMMRIPEASMSAWQDALDGIEDSVGALALTRHIRESERAPRPADIIKRVMEVRSGSLPVESIKDRMVRLHRAASFRVKTRLDKFDEDELRFQRWQLRASVIRGDLTDDLRNYFNRVLGTQEVVETVSDIEAHRA